MKKQLSIVKIGGNVINNSEQLDLFLHNFAKLDGLKILVHGGGRRATEMADSLGLHPKMIGGRRVTDEANLEVVTMVYAGGIDSCIITNGWTDLGCECEASTCPCGHNPFWRR